MAAVKTASAVLPQVVAAEAVYNALGYALSAYIRNIKQLDIPYANELVDGELTDYNITSILNEIKPIRELLNVKYVKDPAVKKFEPTTQIKSDRQTETDLLEAWQVIRSASSDAVSEFQDSLLHYKKSGADYSSLIKTVRTKTISQPIKFFQKITKKADEEIMKLMIGE
jgi:hypothetical protein